MICKIRGMPACMAGLFALLLLLPEARLWSQATGTIRGIVTGTAQQPVPGAQVGVINTRGAKLAASQLPAEAAPPPA